MLHRRISLHVSNNYNQSVYRRTLSLGVVRALVVLAVLLGVVLLLALVLAGSGAYRIARVSYLEGRNRLLEVEFAKLTELRRRIDLLEEQEQRYAQMLGVELTPRPVDWRSVPVDSVVIPDWARADTWGTRPVPAVFPVAEFAVSRGFSAQHPGIDLAAQTGMTVRAAADGVVSARGTDSVFGRYLLLDHPGGFETYYGHLDRWRAERDDSVRAGQAIGTVGSSGRSSAPHLHFEVRRHGEHLDPATMFRFR